MPQLLLQRVRYTVHNLLENFPTAAAWWVRSCRHPPSFVSSMCAGLLAHNDQRDAIMVAMLANAACIALHALLR